MDILNDVGTSNADDFEQLYAVTMYDEDTCDEISVVEQLHMSLGFPGSYKGDYEPLDSLKTLIFRDDDDDEYDRQAVEDALMLMWRMSGLNADEFMKALLDDCYNRCFMMDEQCLKLLKKVLKLQKEVLITLRDIDFTNRKAAARSKEFEKAHKQRIADYEELTQLRKAWDESETKSKAEFDAIVRQEIAWQKSAAISEAMLLRT